MSFDSGRNLPSQIIWIRTYAENGMAMWATRGHATVEWPRRLVSHGHVLPLALLNRFRAFWTIGSDEHMGQPSVGD